MRRVNRAATKARAGGREEEASRFPCSIPVERSQCRITMAGMDHLFLLLGLSQSHLKIEREPGRNVPFRGKIAFLARLARSLACNASKNSGLEFRRCEVSFSGREIHDVDFARFRGEAWILSGVSRSSSSETIEPIPL